MDIKKLKENTVEYLQGRASKAAAEEIEQLIRYDRSAAFDLLIQYNAMIFAGIIVDPGIETFVFQIVEMHDMKDTQAMFHGMQIALGKGHFKRKESTIQEIIDRGGGKPQFAKLHGIPFNTVQKWYHNKETVPDWLLKMLNQLTME